MPLSRVLVVVTLILGAFFVGQRAQPTETPASRASQHVTRSARHKPSLSALQKKLTKLAGAVGSLKRQLAANSAADAAYLKAADANAQFLKVDGTASNAQKVGGIAPGELVQGKAQLQTSAVTVAAAGNESQLFGDGSVRILVGLDSGTGAPYGKVVNETSSLLYLTAIGAPLAQNSVAANSTVTFAPNQPQISVQIVDTTGRLWTATLSVLATGAGELFAGQMVAGLR